MYENLARILLKEKLFPIIRSHDIGVVRDTAQALIDGGAKIFEINVENPGIYRVIEEMSDHACICAGGIITSMQAQTAIAAGAKILSSPIFQMNLVKFQKISKFLSLPELLPQMKLTTLGKQEFP